MLSDVYVKLRTVCPWNTLKHFGTLWNNFGTNSHAARIQPRSTESTRFPAARIHYGTEIRKSVCPTELEYRTPLTSCRVASNITVFDDFYGFEVVTAGVRTFYNL